LDLWTWPYAVSAALQASYKYNATDKTRTQT
jgi:hypothetical protein